MASQGKAGAHGRAGGGNTRQGQTERGGGEPTMAPAPRSGWHAAFERYRKSVWAPVVGKAFAIFLGMVALASIGASSIARGSASAASADAPHAPGLLAGGLSPLSGSPRPRTSAPASDYVGQHADAGAGSNDSGSNGNATDGGSADSAPASAGLTSDGKVILNRASLADLRKLPGIGAKRAQAILDLRTKLGGRFRRITELLRVKGIGPKRLQKLKNKMVLDAPEGQSRE